MVDQFHGFVSFSYTFPIHSNLGICNRRSVLAVWSKRISILWSYWVPVQVQTRDIEDMAEKIRLMETKFAENIADLKETLAEDRSNMLTLLQRIEKLSEATCWFASRLKWAWIQVNHDINLLYIFIYSQFAFYSNQIPVQLHSTCILILSWVEGYITSSKILGNEKEKDNHCKPLELFIFL